MGASTPKKAESSRNFIFKNMNIIKHLALSL